MYSILLLSPLCFLVSGSVSGLFYVDATTFSLASLDPKDGEIKIFSNITLNQNAQNAFDDSWGTSCDSQNNLMFAGLGYGFFKGPSGRGSQELLTFHSKTGEIMHRATISSPKAEKWLKKLHFDKRHQRLWISYETYTWDPKRDKSYVVASMDIRTGDLHDVNSFNPYGFGGISFFVDHATCFNEKTQQMIGIGKNDEDDTAILWKLSTKLKTPVSFENVTWKGVPFRGRIWGMKWTEKYGIIANTCDLPIAATSLITINESGEISVLFSGIPFTLTNWEPSFHEKDSVLVTYGNGQEQEIFILRFDLGRGTWTSRKAYGKDYQQQPLKGFCA